MSINGDAAQGSRASPADFIFYDPDELRISYAHPRGVHLRRVHALTPPRMPSHGVLALTTVRPVPSRRLQGLACNVNVTVM